MKILTLLGAAHALRKATDAKGGATVPDLSAADLRKLGAMLERVAYDEDARAVFNQPARGKGQPAERLRNRDIVLLYWRHRIAHPEDAAGAAELVRQRFGLDRKTTERIARKHREVTLWALEGHFARRDGERVITGRRGLDTSALRAHLARKSKGGNRPK